MELWDISQCDSEIDVIKINNRQQKKRSLKLMLAECNKADKVRCGRNTNHFTIYIILII